MNNNGSRFHHLGFPFANHSSNAFLNLSNIMQAEGVGSHYCTDTDLRLDSVSKFFPSMSALKGTKRKWGEIDGLLVPKDDFSLVLGLGRPQSSSDSKGSSATACTSITSPKENEEKSSIDLSLDFHLHLGTDKIATANKSASLTPKASEVRPKFDLELSLSTGPAESGLTSITLGSNIPQNNFRISPQNNFPSLDSALLNKEIMPSHLKISNDLHPLHGLLDKNTGYGINQIPGNYGLVPSVPDVTTRRSCTSGITQLQQRSSGSKTCQFEGCGKGARGASGLCIAHGGGRRCQKFGCHKGAEGRTVYCKAHGGGRRCQYLGCTKSAEGRTDHCIAHGGGRRCSHEGCSRAARGRSGLCIRHGGGKRCQKENCTRSAEGFSGLCISHGGGRRCQFTDCTKGAQGSTMFCKAHGGGKRCTIPGCKKGAEGSTPFCKGHGGGKRCSFEGGCICPKSVHGGTLFCVAHGGGKRCVAPDCTKSARGRTDFCVRHGGGKRCKSEGCGKSAQGSTDFCKAHGGGKRCSWGQPGSELGNQVATPCDRFARGKTGLCASHNALVHDKRVHGASHNSLVQDKQVHGASHNSLVQDKQVHEVRILKCTVQDPKLTKPEKMKGVINAIDMHIDSLKFGTTEDNVANWDDFNPIQSLSLQFMPPLHLPIAKSNLPSDSASISEGRVHGGSLMAMLTDKNHQQQLGNGCSSELGRPHTYPW